MARESENFSVSSRWLRSSQLRLSDRHHGAGAHHGLHLVARKRGAVGDGLLQRHLHLGERRDRHPDGQIGIEHMVLAHIGVGKHVVAEFLAASEARAVTEHQPGLRAQHRDMVGDRLGVGWADADIDERNAGMIRALQMVGRHLRQAGRWHGFACRKSQKRIMRDEIAGLDETRIAAIAARE